MTGVERLEGISMALGSYVWGASLSEALADIADQIKREHAEDCFRMGERAADVSMSAYDLLPQEDREAIAWVKEHGGIAYVRDAWRVRSNLDRQLGKEQAKVERQQRHIESIQGKLRERRERIEELNRELDELDDICGGESVKDTLEEALNLCATIGCEPSSAVGEELVWALGECTSIVSKRLMPEGMEWPRFEDGEPVRIGDTAPFGSDDVMEVVGVELNRFGYVLHGSINDGTRECVDGDEHGVAVKRPAPKVLDADGVEIYEGRIAYGTRGRKYRVTALCEYEPSIVHAQAQDDAEMGDEFIAANTGLNSYQLDASKLTHERLDSWERLEEDVANASCPDVYCANHSIDASDASYEGSRARDIGRRAKALAERDR